MKRTKQILATIISLIILNFFVGTVKAQVCDGDYIIDDNETSADIATVSGCTEIIGDLSIQNTSLTSLGGLDNLTSVGGSLDIRENDALTSLSGLDNLTSVGDNLYIERNTSLSSLNGLETLNTIPKDLFISENTVLTSLTGLEGLTSVGMNFWIDDNNVLTSLGGLDNLTSVGGSLDISENDSLTSLGGLDNLTSVGGSLDIRENDALINLCALYNVNLGANTLLIRYNVSLSMDTANALKDQLIIKGFTGTSYVDNNGGSGLVTCDDDCVDADSDGVCDDPIVVNINLEDYELCLWDFSGTYTDSRDNMTTLTYTLIQDVKGKLTGTGTFEDLSGGDNMTIPVEIKGKVKGKKSIVTLKYKVKGKNAEKDKIQNNLKLELVEDNETTLAGTEKWKICQKGAGCVKGDGEVSLDAPDGMTGEAVLSIISFDNGTSGKNLLGKAELILNNDDVYDLDAKGAYKSKKDVTKYSLKGDNETAKGIQFKLKIDGDGDGEDIATQINGKALGQKLKYKLQ